MYGKEARNRKQEIDRQHHTIPNQRNQRPKEKHFSRYTVFRKGENWVKVSIKSLTEHIRLHIIANIISLLKERSIHCESRIGQKNDY